MKRTISIVMVIVMLILTSCGNSQKVSNYNNSLELVTHIDGIMGNTIAANENGWYQIYDNVNGYANIMYTDFQTKTTHFLCSRPECLHNDDSCNSFVKNKYGGNMLFLSEDSLYLLHHSISSNFTPEINEFSYIEKMDLSGNNKKRIIDFPSNESIWGAIVLNQNSLFFMHDTANRQPNGEIIISRNLVQLDIHTGSLSTIAELQDGFYYIVNAFNDYIVIKTFEETKTALTLYNVSTGKSEKVLEWNQNDYIGDFIGSSFYYVDKTKDNKIYEYNLLTHKRQVTSDKFPKLSKSAIINRVGIFDNKLVLYVKDSRSNMFGQYAVNILTGEVFEITSKFLDHFGEENIMDIIYETKNNFVILSNIITEEIEIKAPNNSHYISTTLSPEYSIITKENYWSGNLQYEIITK